MKGKERITRSEVALRAGVSKTTVTYVLADTPGAHIGAQTRARVKRIARRLGYQPSFAATSLVRGRTDIIGLLLPSQEMQFSAYYARMIAGLLEASRHTPCHFLYLGQNQPEKYRRCLARGSLDSVIILQSDTDGSHVEAVRACGGPALTMNYLNSLELPQVSMDYEGAVDAAYSLLFGRGRKRIAFLCNRFECQPNIRHIERHKELTARYAGRAEIIHVCLDGYGSVREAWQAELAAGGWVGIVVDGREPGMQLCDALAAAGQRIGEDFDIVIIVTGPSIAGIPPQAHVLEAQPEVVGRTAWKVMERILAGEQDIERTTMVPFLLRDGARGKE